MTPEGRVKAKVKKILSEAGAWFVMPVTGGYGNSGAPDFVVCHAGHFLGIECKAGGNKPTALQYKNLADIMRCGGEALVVNEDNVHQLKEVLDSYEKAQ